MVTQTVKPVVTPIATPTIDPSIASDNQGETHQGERSLADDPKIEKILCQHCKRTATNGIKCKGICVADDNY